MNDRKSIAVGLFVLTGLVFLGFMIVWFEGVAQFLRGGYFVTGHVASAVGITVGKRVHRDGVMIGEVESVTSSQPAQAGVNVRMRIKPGERIPRAYRLVIPYQVMGDVLLDFRPVKLAAGAPPSATPAGNWPDDGTANVGEGLPKAPDLLPEDVLEDVREGLATLKGLKTLIPNLEEMTAPRTLEEVRDGKKAPNLWTGMAQFQDTAKTLQDQLTDPKSPFNTLLTKAGTSADELTKRLQEAGAAVEEARKTIATINEAAKGFQTAGEKTSAVMDKSAALADKLTKDAEKAEDLLDNLNGLVTGIRDGKGTLGKLVTDDELHRSLVNLAENLQVMTDSANRLIIMWRQEGILSKEK